MDQKAVAFAHSWARRYVRTKHPHGLDEEDVEIASWSPFSYDGGASRRFRLRESLRYTTAAACYFIAEWARHAEGESPVAFVNTERSERSLR